MKTKEELNELKEKIDILNKKLCELTEDELEQVVGGGDDPGIITVKVACKYCGRVFNSFSELRKHTCQK